MQERQRCVARYRGQVKWFNNGKGFGFIGREGEPDLFVHYSAIRSEGYKTLSTGDEVEFDIIDGPKGRPQAEGVICLTQSAKSDARPPEL